MTVGNCQKTDIALPLFVCVAHNGRVHTHMRCMFCIKIRRKTYEEDFECKFLFS